jgi:hypothetical protein
MFSAKKPSVTAAKSIKNSRKYSLNSLLLFEDEDPLLIVLE